MKYVPKNMLRACAIAPATCLADPVGNSKHILDIIGAAYSAGASLVALPELCIWIAEKAEII